MDIFAERGLPLTSTLQHKMIYRYMWRQDEKDKQNGLITYVVVDEKLRKDVLDAKVVKRMLEGLDQNGV